MVLHLSNCDIQLPSYQSHEERCAYCEAIINEFPHEFVYTLPHNSNVNSISHGEIVEQRLSLLGSYILAIAPKDDEYNIPTRYAEKRNRERELHFSSIESWNKANREK